MEIRGTELRSSGGPEPAAGGGPGRFAIREKDTAGAVGVILAAGAAGMIAAIFAEAAPPVAAAASAPPEAPL